MHLGIIKITYNRTATHFMDDSFVNLGEEVILNLLWPPGASESPTVCFVISLSICYWLLKCGVLHVVCVCERERERERERQGHILAHHLNRGLCVCVCVCVCVWERERERERREREREREARVHLAHHLNRGLCCGCVSERERGERRPSQGSHL